MATQTQLMSRSNGRVEAMRQREAIAPVVDVYENVDELLLVVDVPGVTSDEIDLQLDRGQLTVLATRRKDALGSLLAAEYQSCDYLRVFSVPQGIDPSKIDAQVTGGVLRVRLPKSVSAKPRRIEVREG